MRYFIELSYNGKAYHGWQKQPNAVTVQETLEKALRVLLGTKTDIVGAGRTDTGVHALQLFAHFDASSQTNTEELLYKLNAFLPKDIAIKQLFKVNNDAHARFSAIKRTYKYNVQLTKNAFNYEFAYYVSQALDLEKMNNACKILLKYTDFECFSKRHTDVKTYNCTIEAAFWEKKDNLLVFTISADRFLRNMVRAIVGTLINIGLNKYDINHLHDIILSKDRSRAGYSVPAKGLFLTGVEYPKTIYS